MVEKNIVIIDYKKDNLIIKIPNDLIDLSNSMKKFIPKDTMKMDKDIEKLKKQIKELEKR